MARSRRPGSNKRWSDLSPSYRARLKGAGVTREGWLRGNDLRSSRGHAFRSSDAAPAKVVTRFVAGEGSPADLDVLARWRRTTAPSWLPSDPMFMDDDVAAALSQIGRPPSRWRSVRFTPRDGTQPWTMTVSFKNRRAYDRTIEIPGGGAPSSPAWQVLDWLANPGDYDTRRDEEIDYDVGGSE